MCNFFFAAMLFGAVAAGVGCDSASGPTDPGGAGGFGSHPLIQPPAGGSGGEDPWPLDGGHEDEGVEDPLLDANLPQDSEPHQGCAEWEDDNCAALGCTLSIAIPETCLWNCWNGAVGNSLRPLREAEEQLVRSYCFTPDGGVPAP